MDTHRSSNDRPSRPIRPVTVPIAMVHTEAAPPSGPVSGGALACYIILSSTLAPRASGPVSQRSIAQAMGKSHRSVMIYLRELESTGWIEVMHSAGPDGAHRANIYTVRDRPRVDDVA